MRYSGKYKLIIIISLLSIKTSFGIDSENSTTIYDSLIMLQENKIEAAKQGSDSNRITREYWNLGYLYASNNDIEKALLTYKKALSLAEKYRDSTGIFRIYESMGEVLLKEPKYLEVAEILIRKGFEIKHSEFNTACLYRHIGVIRFKEGKFNESEDYFQKSNAIAKSLHKRHLMSLNYEWLGYIYEQESKKGLAIENFQKCYETGCPICPKINFFNALIKIADLNFNQSNRSEAEKYYKKALLLAEEFNAPKELAIANLKIGNLYLRNENRKSVYHYQIAFDEAQKAGDKLILKTISDTLASFYKELKEYKKALYYKDISFDLQNTLNNASGKEEMVKLATNIEFNNFIEEIKQKHDLDQKVINQQKSAKKILSVFTIIIALIGAFILYRYKKKRKEASHFILQNNDLEIKNKQIQTELSKIKKDKQRLLLSILESEIQADQMLNGVIVDLDKKLLEDCQQIIYNNIDNSEFTVNTLANEVGMSQRNLYRKIKELTNCNPSDLIKSCRMRYASQIITQNNIRISEVATLAGYEDAKRFSQAFKLFFGQTPSDFLNNHKVSV